MGLSEALVLAGWSSLAGWSGLTNCGICTAVEGPSWWKSQTVVSTAMTCKSVEQWGDWYSESRKSRDQIKTWFIRGFARTEGGICISRPCFLPEKLFPATLGKRLSERLAVVRGCGLNQTLKGRKSVSLWGFLGDVLQGCLPSFLQSLGPSDTQPTTFCLLHLCTRGHVCTSNPWLIYFLALLTVVIWLKFDLKATLCLRNTKNRFQKLTGKVDYRRFCPVVPTAERP